MRVLLMADSFGTTGGGEVMVSYLARELQKRHTVAILTAGEGANERSIWHGIDVYQIHSDYHPRLRPAISIVNPATIRGVRGALRSFRPDVVHAWNVHHHLGYESLRLAEQHAPVVHTSQDALAFCYTKFHCWIDPGNVGQALPAPRAHPESCRSCRSLFWSFPVRNRLARAYLARSVSVPVAVSHALAAGLEANGLRRPRVVHNGIPPEDFESDLAAARSVSEHWDLGDGVAILAGGRLGHFKGHELALRAFHRAATGHPTARLLVMGGYGWYGERLTNLARELGIPERVRLLGLVPRETVPAVLNRSAAVLTLSMYLDPFPTMNLEAMAASRAVVGTCFGGTPEAVEDGVTGFVVNPYDSDAVVARIAELLDVGGRGDELGNAGRQRLMDCFRVEQMTASYESIYEELLTA